MADREYPDFVAFRPITIQRDVAGFAVRDHKLAQPLRDNPPDEGVGRQQGDAISDCTYRGRSRPRIDGGDKLESPLDVLKRVVGIGYLRQGAGRRGFSPLARRSIQACTSSAR